MLREKDLKVLLFVDNYDDALVRSSLDNIHEIYQILHQYLDEVITMGMRKNVIAGGCILGLPVDASPTWVFEDSYSRVFLEKVCDDRTYDGVIGHAFGVIPQEMLALGHELLGSEEDAERFVNDVRLNCLPLSLYFKTYIGFSTFSFPEVFSFLKVHMDRASAFNN